MARPIPIPSEAGTIAAILEQRARMNPHALAFVAGSESMTFAALHEDALRIAATFAHEGIGRGDRVALLLPAGLDFVRAFYALQRIGAIPCAFDPAVPAAATTRRVARVRPAIVVREIPTGGAGRIAGPTQSDEEAIAFLQPTSGSTGEPRAAMIRQRNVIASLASARELLDPVATDVLVGWVPPWHDLGLLRFVLGPVYFGIACHLVPPAIRTIPQWLATIAKVRGTITGAPDFAYRLAVRLASAIDLSSLRYATNGGEPVRATTIESFEAHFGIRGVVRPGYGLAEATLGVTSVRAGEAIRVDARGNVSCGKPLAGVEVAIDDAGEILVRSAAVFAGYFDDDATRDEWLRTGDIGQLDADGNLYVLGRERALLKRGGVPLAPRELEEAAQSVDGVRVAAAVGMPPSHDGVTEQIVVAIEVHPTADEDEIQNAVSNAIASAVGFAPDHVVVLEPRSIPRTHNGKIRHSALRELLSDNRRNSPSVSSVGASRR